MWSARIVSGGVFWVVLCNARSSLVSSAPNTSFIPIQENMVKKLTRQEIREGLDTIPVEILLSSGKGKKPALTTKQREFARSIALGKTKAQAYRDTHKENATKNTLACEPYRLASDPRIATEVEAYRLAIEAEKHRTPAQLKSLLVQQLVQHSLDEDFPPAQRVQCLKLLGSLFEVQAFTEHKTVERIDHKSDDIKARLLKVLGSHVVDVDAKASPNDTDNGAESLLAELVSPPDAIETPSADTHPTGEPPSEPVARGSATHTISHIQSTEKSDDFDAP